ncbi:hypothetical protein HPB50_018521 [Hyalomma asiaticum]|uniref:Uncharacterized protein n=1 Tax=Hyalomma asiaticum TaxID=266040 RepID=A0ACB7TJX9_HYAAI|nr:hypothetical protein HPB50_018521 [Hyalomma asiaticum]
MMHRVILGCNNYSQSRPKKLKGHTKDYSFFKIPKMRLHECGKAKKLSERWRLGYRVRGIQEANADNYFVCSRHPVSGT